MTLLMFNQPSAMFGGGEERLATPAREQANLASAAGRQQFARLLTTRGQRAAQARAARARTGR
jgi:hypothetical protein